MNYIIIRNNYLVLISVRLIIRIERVFRVIGCDLVVGVFHKVLNIFSLDENL